MNFFSSLFPFVKGTEDYCTACFALLLATAVKEDPRFFEHLLQTLLRLGELYPAAGPDGTPTEIHTQRSEDESGTPDLTIIGPDYLVLIEVKVGSPINPEQLERYAKRMRDYATQKPRRGLVLLTKAPCRGTPAPVHLPFRGRTWTRVERALHEREPIGSTLPALVDHFSEFLRSEAIAMAPIHNTLSEGLGQAFGFLHLLEDALHGVAGGRYVTKDGRAGQETFGERSIGCYFPFKGRGKGREIYYWAGIRLSDPEVLELAITSDSFFATLKANSKNQFHPILQAIIAHNTGWPEAGDNLAGEPDMKLRRIIDRNSTKKFPLHELYGFEEAQQRGWVEGKINEFVNQFEEAPGVIDFLPTRP